MLSFWFNYRATRRNQQDTQFYEALKRIGDKDSPTLRASAAGLIAQMAQKSTFGKAKRSRYFETAIDQLTTCLALENDDAVIGATEKAIVQFAHADARRILHRIYAQNIDLQDHLLIAVVTFFASSKANVTGVIDYGSVAAVNAFDESVFHRMVDWQGVGVFEQRCRAASLVAPCDPPEEARRFHATAIAALRAAATRLRASTTALAATVRGRRRWRPFYCYLAGAFLCDADLSGADLSRADLSGADLSGADLESANLNKANMIDADLKRANLNKAKLSFADLSGANLSRTHLIGANLRDADLSHADLSHANLSGADLESANLNKANLIGANLIGADLKRVNLKRANLSYAMLFGADLGGANLEGTLGMEAASEDAGQIDVQASSDDSHGESDQGETTLNTDADKHADAERTALESAR